MKTKHKRKNKPFSNGMSYRATDKWMNTYHDMMVVAHNTLMEMSLLYKMKVIKDKRIETMINNYRKERRKL